MSATQVVYVPVYQHQPPSYTQAAGTSAGPPPQQSYCNPSFGYRAYGSAFAAGSYDDGGGVPWEPTPKDAVVSTAPPRQTAASPGSYRSDAGPYYGAMSQQRNAAPSSGSADRQPTAATLPLQMAAPRFAGAYRQNGRTHRSYLGSGSTTNQFQPIQPNWW
ncbi:hypothetical protein STCU_10180 [Strigomonas culicis]|uniref:Uncharacterized protein n=1 Tax=Strigomonas culicis TaxID=28005 RepID=S9TN14_9TRYP|nr:hypothetical protein STCU_10180 [Strigomonas culicis]|eukprot:EPY18114.1 hypothetical protein STCU_10180 [Strigomonas culicis]